MCLIKICFPIVHKCTLRELSFSKGFQTHCIQMALSHLWRTPCLLIKCLVIPADIFQLVLPQKEASQMKDMCTSPEGRNVASAAPCIKDWYRKRRCLFYSGLRWLLLKFAKTKVNFSKNEKNAFNKWIIHKCPRTVCPCNRNPTEQPKCSDCDVQ